MEITLAENIHVIRKQCNFKKALTKTHSSTCHQTSALLLRIRRHSIVKVGEKLIHRLISQYFNKMYHQLELEKRHSKSWRHLFVFFVCFFFFFFFLQ